MNDQQIWQHMIGDVQPEDQWGMYRMFADVTGGRIDEDATIEGCVAEVLRFMPRNATATRVTFGLNPGQLTASLERTIRQAI